MSSPNRVLVVDDDTGGRRLTRATLKKAGFEVIEAADGQQAVDAFRAQLPDLVLMDVSMPVMDGFTACAELRRIPGAQRVPVVMMTGLDDVESIERAFEVGASDFITKPINWTILAHRVRYMLRASTAINGKPFTVASSVSVSLLSAQGELPHLPALGAPFAMVELRSTDGEVLSIDYGPALGGGVRHDDPAFKINWPLPVSCLSERDRAYPDFDAQQHRSRCQHAAAGGHHAA